MRSLTTHDRERHGRHTSGFRMVLPQHGGRLLASDQRDKVVLRSFADRPAYEARASSEADPRIAQGRIAATESPVLRLRGIC